MTSSFPPDNDDSIDSARALSGDAITPRGGFMARPGFKSPPRHAVVVRGGDAPESEHIPRFRSSIPPPPPPAEPSPPSNDERITLRAIPTSAGSKPPVAPAVESLPPASASGDAPLSASPLSDAPFVSSVVESGAPESRRSGRSRWTIFAAAAAGLVLGLGSVAARVYAPGAPEQPPTAAATLSQSAATPLATTLPSTTPPAPASSLAAPRRARQATAASDSSPVTPEAEPAAGEGKLGRQATPSAKRSIF